MSPRRVRGTCSTPLCDRPSWARGLCRRHYEQWRTSDPAPAIERVPANAWRTSQVAAALGITTGALFRAIARGRYAPDGRAEGRNWWWPETVESWTVTAPPADAVRSAEAAKLLGIGQSQLHRLARSGRLPADGTFGGRRARWWRRATIERYQAQVPDGALWTGDVARRLGVSRETVRRLAATSLPPDGVDRGRRWWLPHRFEEP